MYLCICNGYELTLFMHNYIRLKLKKIDIRFMWEGSEDNTVAGPSPRIVWA